MYTPKHRYRIREPAAGVMEHKHLEECEINYVGYGNKCFIMCNADWQCVDRYTAETDFTSVDNTICCIRGGGKCDST